MRPARPLFSATFVWSLLVACTETVPPVVLNTPVVEIAPPSGTQRAIIPLDYTLYDGESDSASIVTEYSINDGSTWSPASRSGVLGEGTSGLATSPAGVNHTFFWAALADGVATSGAVSTVRFRITPADGEVGLPVTTLPFTVHNDLQLVIGVASASFPRNGTLERTAETALGDLVADALRLRAGTQLAIINGGSIRSPLPSSFVATNGSLRRGGTGPFDLVMGDVYTVLPFSNRLVTRTVTGTVLRQILERSVSFMPTANGAFLQVSGFSFTYSVSAPVGSRVQNVTLSGGGAIVANSTSYTLALNDFLNAGGDGYTMLADGTGTAREIAADVLLDYILAAGTISPATTGRITQLP